MALIDDTLNFLGLPYCIRNIDLEPVIYRSMVQYEFEISGLHGNTVNCALYVWRTAVYYADHEARDPGKLKWWYWKDKTYPEKEDL